MNKRIEWIDICKGIGILAMICGHISLPYIADKYIHAWHMPIFFILSGYLFKEFELKELIKRKFKSLLIPYFSFASILYMLSILRNLIKYDTNLIKQLFDLLTFNTIGDLPFGNAIWFLTCLFCTEIIFSVLKKCVKNKLLLSISVIIICLIGFVLSNYNIRLIWGIDSSMIAIGFYYIGYIIKKYKHMKAISKIFEPKIIYIFAVLIITIILIFTNNYVNMRTAEYGNLILFYFNAIFTSLMIIMATIYILKIHVLKNIKNVLIYIGQNSLVYLAFNQLIINILKSVLKLFIYNKVVIGIITLIVTLVMLLVIALIFNKRFKFLLGKFNTNELKKVEV